MDKNQITGLLLIGAILFAYTWWTKPSEAEIEAAKRKQDSLRQVEAIIEQQRVDQENKIKSTDPSEFVQTDSLQNDSIRSQQLQKQYGSFADKAEGEEKFYTIENELIKVIISNKGGKPYSVELKNFQTYDSLPLLLFDGAENEFGLHFFA